MRVGSNIVPNDNDKPEIILFYNETKSGVVLVDKLSVTYNVGKSKRRCTLASIQE